MSDQKQQTAPTDLKTLLIPATILLTGMMIAGALFFGLGGTGGSGNTDDGTVKGEQTVPTPTPTQPAIPPTPQVATTSIDDDAVLGNRNTATVAIVESSDYECSFCKRFVDQTMPQIKQNYIDTGQAILVFRDLPLDFHNPAAENDAMAAECARAQGGDASYFQYHDKIFENTPGNGAGLDGDELATLAVEIGLNGEVLKTCVSDKTFKSEVAADAADAASAGIKGTPGFVVGKLADDGSVEGTVIIGAQPYAAFQSAIEKYLE